MEYCIDYLKKIVGDEDIEVRAFRGMTLLPYSPSEGPALGDCPLSYRRNLARGSYGSLYDDGLQRFQAFLQDK